MKSKEKAWELVEKYIKWVNQIEESYSQKEYAKQCALIVVNEILNEFMFDDSDYSNRRYEFYQEVKQQIERL